MAITPRTKQTEFFSDFGSNLERIPGRSDLSRKINAQAVKESVKNIVLTDRGERLFQPDLGCSIRGSLFENIDQNTIFILKENIKTAIRTYEPRCDVKDIIVNANVDSNQISVKIIFTVINSNNDTTLTIDLDRVR